MRRHRLKIILIVLIAIIGVALVVRACLPPPPGRNLLTRATKLSNVRDVISYSWISNTELIMTASTNGFPVMRPPWTGSVDSIDAITGKRTRLNGLTAAILQHPNSYVPIGPWAFTQSQDGQWLMWVRENPRDGGSYPVTARRDGSGYHEWNLCESERIHNSRWIDGHRWITLHYPKQAAAQPAHRSPDGIILHDAAQPLSDRQLPASSPEAQTMVAAGRQSFVFASFPDKPSLYAEPAEHAFSLDLTIKQAAAVTSPGVPDTNLDTVTFPGGAKALSNMPNPQATCLALTVSDSGVPVYVTLLRKLIPSYPFLAHPTEALYVYRTDRKTLVEIGRVPKTSSNLPEIANAFWQPDGKHIQFFYHNAVYIVSTD